MARFRDESIAINAIQQQLHPGEQLRHWAYGVKQPNVGLIALLMCLAILPGAIAVALMTKEYLIGLTDRRLVVVRFSGGKVNIKEVIEFPLGEIVGRAKTSKGAVFTHIKIAHPQTPFVAKFHRMGAKQNKDQSRAIADALTPALAAHAA